jgi:hypothetical protein
MSDKDLKDELERLRSENAALKKGNYVLAEALKIGRASVYRVLEAS